MNELSNLHNLNTEQRQFMAETLLWIHARAEFIRQQLLNKKTVLSKEAIANGDTRQDEPKAMASAKSVKLTRPGDHTTLAGEKKAGG